MRRFWNSVIKPIFIAENIRNIVEIGADKGDNTANLLQYAKESGGHLDSVDPYPSFPADEWAEKSDGAFKMHRCLSLEAIPSLENADVFLIDGDHNWYTVYNELKLILETYPGHFPLVLFHDICWPYDRRDLYYNPENIPPEYRRPYEKKAIKFGSSELCSEGINSRLNNAVSAGGERNGVKTAVEDFLSGNPQLGLEYYSMDIINGLGMLVNPNAHTEAVRIFNSSDTLFNVLSMAEKERIAIQQKYETIKRNAPANTSPKIYFDYGNGFSEDNAVRLSGYDLSSGSFSAHFTAPKAPQRLRFDPAGNGFCMVSDFVISSDSGILGFKEHNGFEIDNKIVFSTFDSRFYIENPNKAHTFDIKADIAFFTDPAMLKAFMEYRELLKHIAGLKSEIEACRNNEAKTAEENTILEHKLQNSCAENIRLAAMSSEAENQLTAKDARISELCRSLEECRKNADILENKLHITEKSNETYSRAAAEQEHSLSRLKTKLSDQQAMLEKIRAEADSYKKTIAKNNAEISELKNKLNSTSSEAGKWRAMCDYHIKESNRHVNSFRYRIGSAMVDSYGSLGKMLKLPSTLVRILKEYKKNGAETPTPMPALPQKSTAAKPEKKNPPQPAAPAKPKVSPSPYSKEDIIRKNRELAGTPTVKGNPLVSIIILNRNGTENLKQLFASLKSCKFYENYELIFVDNGSTDNSPALINAEKKNFNISLISNKENESFSKANNQGSRIASGDYLLFLNNDIEVTDNWLDELLCAAQNTENCGAVGAQLIYPQVPNSCLNAGKSFCIQHNGIAFGYSEFDDELFIRPYNKGNGMVPFQDEHNAVSDESAVTAACLLMKKSVFDAIGGFDEQYVYGYEDVDLCLKAHRKGFRNILCSSARLFHYEFGTQTKSTSTEVRIRRTNNINHFKEKWQEYLRQNILTDKLTGGKLFAESPLTVAFAVTEATPDTGAGDYFTALELGQSLEKLGCKIKFLSRRGPGDWYNVGTDADVLISMLDCYDVSKITNANRALITVAWARNWFERWAVNPSISDYSVLLASSELGAQQLSDSTGRNVELFPIATNYERFANAVLAAENSEDKERFGCDYAFTGSYWNDQRDIITTLDPSSLPYSFKVFGKNWNQVPNFAPYDSGFVNYQDIPKVYKYTKIVLDDANRVTKSYGSVNSRVFDAIAAGCVVLTNGALGSEGTFNDALPVYNNSEELDSLIRLYMQDDSARASKVKELQEIVLNHHTYDVRAKRLIEIIRGNFLPDSKKIALMIPVPKWSEAESWGDYHFAVAMKKCFEKKGYSVDIRILPEWKTPFDGKTVIVLRGLSVYTPHAQHTNIMWNISHPDDIPADEYNQYDMVYISSLSWAEKLRGELSVPVESMLQCTDPEVFTVDENAPQRFELLFVGNSRKVFRRILKDLLPTKYDLSVYGKNWDGLIDSKYIKGELIPNNQVGQAYHDAAVLLNDHWDDMRSKGFISNRIFDGLSAGAFIISDEVEGLDKVLDGCIVTYHDKKDLAEKLDHYISHPEERHEIARKGQREVREKHTFMQRTEQMLSFIEHKNN